MSYVECVPNFSEGRRPEVISAIAAAIGAVEGAVILDVSSDPSHNRSVITFVAPVERAVSAAFAGIKESLAHIDLNAHVGEHPRIGATDVVPFVPLNGTSMEQCVQLARTLGGRVGEELEIPVYLYERAATRPERANLATIRRGNFEGLRDNIASDPSREPDFGPRRVHPTFGAVAIGARPVLVAYNVYLGGEENLPIAKKIATHVRESSGGLPAVRAMGLLVSGQAQVSMNLVDIDRTPLHVAFDAVRDAAAERGVQVTWSEIVGLVPERALHAAAASHLSLNRFSEAQILENRIRASIATEGTVSQFLADLASSAPVPGGGTAAAHAGAVAASLVHMVANLTIGRKKYLAAEEEMREIAAEAQVLAATLGRLAQEDAAAYTEVSRAYKLPRASDAEAVVRTASIDSALAGAAAVPLETANACARVAELAAAAALRGNQNAVSDAGVAALLADAACKGAAYNVRINVASLSSPASATALLGRTDEAVARAAAASASSARAVELAMLPT